MSKKIKVNFLERKPSDRFIESYSAYNPVTEYCLLDDDYNAIHPQVRCKDYLQDLFWLFRNTTTPKEEKREVIYGFTAANYTKYPLVNKDFYKVGIRFRKRANDEFEIITNELVEFVRTHLNRLEDAFGFPKSTVFLDKSELILVFEFSSKWTDKPYLLSFYLLLIRALFRDNNLTDTKDMLKYILDYPKKHAGETAGFLNKSQYLIEKMFNKDFPDQTWDEYDNVKKIHDTSGVVSYSQYLEQIEKIKTRDVAKVAIPA